VSDDILTELQSSAARLDADDRSMPGTAFQQRARNELMQALASPRLADAPRSSTRLAAVRSGMMHRRLAGVGIGVALFGLVAVPALAAPSSVAGAVTGAVGAVIHDVPPLLVGAPWPAGQPDASDKAPAAASHPGHPAFSTVDESTRNRRTTISATASSTAEQEDGPVNAVSAAADIALSSTSTTTAVGSSDRDDHGAAVSSVAHQAPPAGETHGQQVSSVARSHTTSAVSANGTTSTSTTVSTNVATSTSHAGMDQHGAAVSAVAHLPAPAGENHGQQVSSVARGLATSVTSSEVSTALTTVTTNTGARGNGHGGGQPPKEGAGGNGKTHGR
jgi:hypothetical protein